MKNLQSKVRFLGIIVLLQTIIWIAFTIISMSQVNSTWSSQDFVQWVSRPDIFYVGNYVNATLLTIFVIILFCYMYSYLNKETTAHYLVALIFIPIYGLMNIIAYSIQISIVPQTAQIEILSNSMNGISQHLIQANSKSLMGFINGMAYALLSIPSIIFGIGLYKDYKKYSGICFIASGIASDIGIIGYLLGDSLISTGIMISGVIFLIGLVFIVIEFRSTRNLTISST